VSVSRRHRRAAAILGACALASAACAQPASRFSEPLARAHVEVLAGVIGSRAAGTDANRRARDYVVNELRRSGFDVRVQQADGVRPEFGSTARVSNIIAVKAGSRPEAVALVSHYDSTPDSPGAADDGLGVAVCLEAGRVLARRPHPIYTLVVAVTDAEEFGMMGASALVRDPVVRQVRACLNLEAVGSAGPSLLFETGPGNMWLVNAWARFAPSPAGASYATEVYKRLPNDTDFTILKRAGIPGLNFAPIGNSYLYHTSRDTPGTLQADTLRQTGENAIAIVEALDPIDITKRSPDSGSFVDVRGIGVLTFGSRAGTALVTLALVAGVAAWFRLMVAVRRRFGLARWGLTVLWALVGLAAVAGAMVGASALLRAAREVYQPWYAHPDPFFALLAGAGCATACLLVQAGRLLPKRLRGSGDPLIIWSLTLPVWIALAGAAERFAPGAVPLASIPLLAAGVLLVVAAEGRSLLVRAVSFSALVVSAALWLETTLDLLHFAVAVFGRLPIVTPPFVFPALVAVAGVWLAPPAVATLSGVARGGRRSTIATISLLGVTVLTFLWSLAATAYTFERPEHRSATYVNDLPRGHAFWVVSGNEPPDGPLRNALTRPPWYPVDSRLPASYPLEVPGPFLLAREAGEAVAPPALVRGIVHRAGDAVDVEVAVVPRRPLLAVVFGMPAGVTPVQASLPGVVRQGRWRATFLAAPREGVSFRARFRTADLPEPGALRVIMVAAGLPGGSGWQELPSWLPAERTAWTARSVSIVPVEFRDEQARQVRQISTGGAPGAVE
jgi:Peptidase family M28